MQAAMITPRLNVSEVFREAQLEICKSIERLDGKARFQHDRWNRTDISGNPGGGGDSCVLSNGKIFEQAGVNFSEVFGMLPAEMADKLVGARRDAEFYATGVSIVIHPDSPMIPTTHANIRYLEVEGTGWFGGGMDLTPYYLFSEDARHFHQVIRATCDRHDAHYYPKFKAWCDEYFYLPHRSETRGVGGIFFDYLGKDAPENLEAIFAFASDLPQAFLEAYLPIVERTMELPWGEKEKNFQLLRRGRYVEFNLLYDRGTQFGLKTGGRTESILMSLPPEVRWQYNFQPAPGSPEAELIEALKHPREWV